MQLTSSFKLVFLKQMLRGFLLSDASSNSMSFHERKNAIKLSADAAIAFARGRTRWSQGLITNLSKNEKNKEILKSLLGREYDNLRKPCSNSLKIPRSKKILRRCLRMCSRRKKAGRAQHICKSILAKALAKKRIQVLKKLVPGGESMDGFSLLDETLDYAMSLKAQVDVMRRLLKTSKASLNIKQMKAWGQGGIDFTARGHL
ncbi:transcription factor IBH1-like 1 isoform X1 [Zingiber officinale]|uniref:transcription factor IBH1-like 1 isoform X1 n=1 Tax=Zingiber officinale TaxID=94328 RepID=UPI001C4B5FA0|nr:transcription factor IBH1-like 1 isoform X1 [Zingiber officinale]